MSAKTAKTTKTTKKEAFQALYSASRARNVSAALDAYVRAPRGTFDMYRDQLPPTWPGMPRSDLQPLTFYNDPATKPVDYLDDLAAQGRFPQLDKWFRRAPKKRDLVRRGGALSSWVSYMFTHIQNVRRGTPPKKNAPPRVVSKASRNSAWLQTYMTRHALRAPARPQRASPNPLHRIVFLTPSQYKKLLDRGGWSDKGFQAFTRKVPTGSNSNDELAVVFRLMLDDVARGTPWVWFVGKNERDRHPAVKRWADLGWSDVGMPGEHEVLLPPGTLQVKKYGDDGEEYLDINENAYSFNEDGEESQYRLVNVTFTPAPEFAWKPRRKGTRESDDNIPWNIFANANATRKRERTPNRQPNQQGPPPARQRMVSR